METAMRRTKCLRETPKTLSDQAEWPSWIIAVRGDMKFKYLPGIKEKTIMQCYPGLLPILNQKVVFNLFTYSFIVFQC